MEPKTQLLISIALLLVSIHVFLTSMHNIDICTNDMRINNMYQEKTGQIINMQEVDIKLNKVVLSDCYLSGLKWSIYGMYFIIASAIFLGYSISRVNGEW